MKLKGLFSTVIALTLIISPLSSITGSEAEAAAAAAANKEDAGLVGSKGMVLGQISTLYSESGLLSSPQSFLQLEDGSFVVADTHNHVLRLLTEGKSEVLAGAALSYKRDAGGNPIGAWLDAEADLAFFNAPAGLAADDNEHIYIADSGNHSIRKLADGKVTTVAGSYTPGYNDGAASEARFNSPQDVAIAADGTLYVADTLNHVIRKISPAGEVTTIGDPALRAAEVYAGVAVFAGGYKNGALSEAQFNEPSALALDAAGNLYVSDTGNQVIRYIDFSKDVVTTAAGAAPSDLTTLYAEPGFQDGAAEEARFNSPRGLTWTDNNELIIADSLNHAVRRLHNGVVSTIIGTLSGASGFVDGPESSARLNKPVDINEGVNGQLFLLDSNNGAVREWTSYSAPEGWERNGASVGIAFQGSLVESDTEPQLVKGRVMLPVRVISELFGYTVTFEEDERRAELSDSNQTITLHAGEQEIVIDKADGSSTVLVSDTAAYISKDRIFVPLRILAEAIGMDVEWVQKERLVVLREQPEAAVTPSIDESFAAVKDRELEIVSIVGDASVTMGGFLHIEAHTGMKLSQGSSIKVNEGATAKLRIVDTGDEITVSGRSIITISELSKSALANTTRLDAAGGNIYFNVSDLTRSPDVFEVKANGTIYSVRGTHFVVSVDPVTGLPTMMVAAGRVEASTGTGNASAPPSNIILPGQNFIRNDADIPSSATMDSSDLINSMSSDVLAALLRGISEIKQENDAWLAQLNEQNSGSNNNPLASLDNYREQLQRLVENLLKDGKSSNALSQEEIQQIVDDINGKITDPSKRINLDRPKVPVDAKTDAKKRQQEQLEQQKKKMQAEQLELENKMRQQELLRKLEEQLRLQKEANEKAMLDMKKEAEEKLLQQLASAERERFEAARKAAEQARNEQKRPAPTTPVPPVVRPSPTPEVTPTPTPEVTPTPTPEVTPTPTPTPTPSSTPDEPSVPASIVHYGDYRSEVGINEPVIFNYALMAQESDADIEADLRVRVKLENNGAPVSGVELVVNDALLMEMDSEGYYIIQDGTGNDFKLSDLIERGEIPLSYRVVLFETGAISITTELLEVDGEQLHLVAKETLTVNVNPAAEFTSLCDQDLDIVLCDPVYDVPPFDEDFSWLYRLTAMGLDGDTKVSLRLRLHEGITGDPAAGQLFYIYVYRNDFDGPSFFEQAVETNSDGSIVIADDSSWLGTVEELGLWDGGIMIQIQPANVKDGAYWIALELSVDGDQAIMDDSYEWGFNVSRPEPE